MGELREEDCLVPEVQIVWRWGRGEEVAPRPSLSGMWSHL